MSSSAKSSCQQGMVENIVTGICYCLIKNAEQELSKGTIQLTGPFSCVIIRLIGRTQAKESAQTLVFCHVHKGRGLLVVCCTALAARTSLHSGQHGRSDLLFLVEL